MLCVCVQDVLCLVCVVCVCLCVLRSMVIVVCEFSFLMMWMCGVCICEKSCARVVSRCFLTSLVCSVVVVVPMWWSCRVVLIAFTSCCFVLVGVSNETHITTHETRTRTHDFHKLQTTHIHITKNHDAHNTTTIIDSVELHSLRSGTQIFVCVS